MSTTANPVFGGIELGGTKLVAMVARGPDHVIAETRIATTVPDETLGRAVEFLTGQHRRARLAAIGIASFGPLDLARGSRTHGSITSTPKARWSGTDLAAPFRSALGVPVAVDTDVNAAAIAEHRWGIGHGADPLVYITVGTGIGGGAVIDGRPLHGLVHPEMGHMAVPRDVTADPFAGICPYHGGCLEGLASAPAIRARWNRAPEELPPDHPAWELEARYLGHALATVVCVLSPRRIVISGGVMNAAGLLPRVRCRMLADLAGYVGAPAILDDVDHYVVVPALGAHAGVLGAIALAMDVASHAAMPHRSERR